MNLASLPFGERPIHFPPGGLDPRPCIVQLRIEGDRGKRLEAAGEEGGKGVSAGSLALALFHMSGVSTFSFLALHCLGFNKNPKT